MSTTPNTNYTENTAIGQLIRSSKNDDGVTTDFNLRDSKDGFDLVWSQARLQENMQNIEAEIRAIESNANLSDTERMFAMQTAMNSWSAVSNLRTNMLKSVSDTLKTIVRNVA